MKQQAATIDDIHRMADEVAQLMASRFGGTRRGEQPRLQDMLRRRGAALPRKLRRQALELARADQLCAQPRVGRQQDMRALGHAHHALIRHLRPLGEISRFQHRAVQIAAVLALSLLLMTALAIWLALQRGLL